MTLSVAKPTYGPGRFFLTQNSTNPTPARPRYVQDMSVDYKAKVDELQSELRFAAATAIGAVSVTGKVSFGSSSPRLWSDALTGDSQAAGQSFLVADELGTKSSNAYTVANPTNSVDRGVVSVATNQPYTRVAPASEVAGASYSFAAGTYTFNASETGTQFRFSYMYTPASPASGTSAISLVNTLQGPGTNFQADMVFPYGTEQDILSLFNCAASDSSFASKQGFAGASLAFTAAVNDNGVLGQWNFARAA